MRKYNSYVTLKLLLALLAGSVVACTPDSGPQISEASNSDALIDGYLGRWTLLPLSVKSVPGAPECVTNICIDVDPHREQSDSPHGVMLVVSFCGERRRYEAAGIRDLDVVSVQERGDDVPDEVGGGITEISLIASDGLGPDLVMRWHKRSVFSSGNECLEMMVVGQSIRYSRDDGDGGRVIIEHALVYGRSL